MKFKIRKSKNGQFYFTLVARNGEPMFSSETYKRKASAIKAIEKLVLGVFHAETIDESSENKKQNIQK